MLGILTVYYKNFFPGTQRTVCCIFYLPDHLDDLKDIEEFRENHLENRRRVGGGIGAAHSKPAVGHFPFTCVGCNSRSGPHKRPFDRMAVNEIFALSGLVAFLVGGWFYLHLYFDYGSFGAFNMESKGFSFANEPASFLHRAGLVAPNTPSFMRPSVRISITSSSLFFYSDTWGDYWGFFSFVNPNEVNLQVNRDIMGPYLGRVNIVSIFPTIFLMGGLVLGAVSLVKALHKNNLEPEHLFRAFLFCGILFSMLGYFWFLISYPNLETGVTNKPTYMIQAFMLLLVLAADLLERLNAYKPLLFRISMLILAFIFVHNLPALISHFNPLTNLLVWK